MEDNEIITTIFSRCISEAQFCGRCLSTAFDANKIGKGAGDGAGGVGEMGQECTEGATEID